MLWERTTCRSMELQLCHAHLGKLSGHPMMIYEAFESILEA